MTEKDEIKELINKINKEYGKDKIKHGDDFPEIERIKTGSLELDYITGGGIPIGRWTRFYGAAGSGKSKVCYKVIANAQERGMTCAYYNSEKQYTPEFAAAHGVNVKNLLIVEGTIIEDIGEIMESLMESIDLHVIDSCSSTVSRVELDDGLNEKEYMAIRPRKWAKQFSFVNERFDQSRNCVILIDQVRVAFGATGITTLAPPGGKFMEHVSSMSLLFKKSKWLYSREDGSLADTKSSTSPTLSGDLEPDGAEIQIRCEKSRVCRPFRSARIKLNLSTNEFDWIAEYVDAAKYFGMVKVKGGWYKVEGMEASLRPKEYRNLLYNDKLLREEIYNRMMKEA